MFLWNFLLHKLRLNATQFWLFTRLLERVLKAYGLKGDLTDLLAWSSCCQGSCSGRPAVLTWYRVCGSLQRVNTTSSSDWLQPGKQRKRFSLTIALSLVSFFIFSPFLQPPALCPLPFLSQLPMWSLFFPPSALHSLLSLADCAELPSIQGAAILRAWWAANRALSTKRPGERRGDCEPSLLHQIEGEAFHWAWTSSADEVCCLTFHPSGASESQIKQDMFSSSCF